MSKKHKNNDRRNKHKEEYADDARLILHDEKLDIGKEHVKTGDVTLHKDIVEEHKKVDVPVTHEEVIIEKRALNEDSDAPIGMEETWHIPTSKEEVKTGKHTVVTGEVEAHKKAFRETEKVDEVLKKERAHIDTDGHPNVTTKNKDKYKH